MQTVTPCIDLRLYISTFTHTTTDAVDAVVDVEETGASDNFTDTSGGDTDD